MLKRYLRTLVWLSLTAAVTVLVLVGLLALRGMLSDEVVLMAICLWCTAVSLVLLPLLARLFATIWFFPGTGEATVEEQLRARLLAINDRPGPVRAVAGKKDIVVTWNYREAEWCELLSRLGQNSIYELRLRFDGTTRTVTMADRMRRAEFLFCPEGVKVGWPRIPLPLLRVRLAKAGSLEGFATAEAYEYTFHPREIKAPIMAAILAAGWNVRFSLF